MPPKIKQEEVARYADMFAAMGSEPRLATLEREVIQSEIDRIGRL